MKYKNAVETNEKKNLSGLRMPMLLYRELMYIFGLQVRSGRKQKTEARNKRRERERSEF